jgi:hypothetical protein
MEAGHTATLSNKKAPAIRQAPISFSRLFVYFASAIFDASGGGTGARTLLLTAGSDIK